MTMIIGIERLQVNGRILQRFAFNPNSKLTPLILMTSA